MQYFPDKVIDFLVDILGNSFELTAYLLSCLIATFVLSDLHELSIYKALLGAPLMAFLVVPLTRIVLVIFSILLLFPIALWRLLKDKVLKQPD